MEKFFEKWEVLYRKNTVRIRQFFKSNNPTYMIYFASLISLDPVQIKEPISLK